MYQICYLGVVHVTCAEFRTALELLQYSVKLGEYRDLGAVQVVNPDLDSGDGLHGLTDDEREALREVLS